MEGREGSQGQSQKWVERMGWNWGGGPGVLS